MSTEPGMAHALAAFFEDEADAAVRGLWRRLDDAGVPSLARHGHGRHRPHLALAVAAAMPVRTVAALRRELRLLAVPQLWLYTLGTFPTKENVLFLGAVPDTELLALHSAVHDVLAGNVKQPWAWYLPGAWVPHCTLAERVSADQLVAGFAALHPITPVRAVIAELGVVDTSTGEVDVLRSAR